MYNYLGFDVRDLSEDAPDDVERMDASAAHVANLLSTEPADSMIFLFLLLEQPTAISLFMLHGH
jgi:hypothetical protein